MQSTMHDPVTSVQSILVYYEKKDMLTVFLSVQNLVKPQTRQSQTASKYTRLGILPDCVVYILQYPTLIE